MVYVKVEDPVCRKGELLSRFFLFDFGRVDKFILRVYDFSMGNGFVSFFFFSVCHRFAMSMDYLLLRINSG
jgi:hypothetical protein